MSIQPGAHSQSIGMLDDSSVQQSGMRLSSDKNFGYYQSNPLDAFKAMYRPALNKGLTVGGVASFAATSLALVTIGLPALAASSLFAGLGVLLTPFGRQTVGMASMGFYGMSLTGLVGKACAGAMSLVLFAGNLGGKDYSLKHSYRQAEALVNYPANRVRQYRIDILNELNNNGQGYADTELRSIPQSMRLYNAEGITDPSKTIFLSNNKV